MNRIDSKRRDRFTSARNRKIGSVSDRKSVDQSNLLMILEPAVLVVPPGFN
jgi:hypothetical protein